MRTNIILLSILLVVCAMDITCNTSESIQKTKQKFKITRVNAQSLTRYSKSQQWLNLTSSDVLKHIIDTEILSKLVIENIIKTFPSTTILNESLSTVYNTLPNSPIQDIRNQTVAAGIKKHFNVTKPVSELILNWIENNEFPSEVSRDKAIELFKSMVLASNKKITCCLVQRKWLKMDKIQFFGYNFANIYDTNVRKWHESLPKISNYNKNKTRALSTNINNNSIVSNVPENHQVMYNVVMNHQTAVQYHLKYHQLLSIQYLILIQCHVVIHFII